MKSQSRIKFSSWYAWKTRSDIPHVENPGVYILSKFRKKPKGKASSIDKRIIYFGETCTGILGRLNQFNGSAFHGKGGHSGGNTYEKKYADRGKNLYVAAFPVNDMPKNLERFFISYVERKLILKFVQKYKDAEKWLLNQK